MTENQKSGLEPARGAGATRRDRYHADLSRLLALLYDPAITETLANTLLDIARERLTRERAAQPDGCLLITYADTLRDDDEVPLATLARFLRRHLHDAVSRVHLLPFYPSSSDDGFAVIDYRLVDHHVGSWEDIGALADDYDLMFDLVINHCSRENLWFADFVTGREPGRHYFITLQEESDTSTVARPRSTPLISPVHTYAGIRHVWNTFSDDQVDLNFANPDVLREFVEILFFYVDQGARMVRLDAIAYLWKRLGTRCTSLPETHAVVKVLRRLLDFARTDVLLVTETNVPHEENVSYFGTGDEAHVVYQFSLAPLLLYSYVFADASYLTNWAARLATPPDGTLFLNFIASHDGIGLRPLEGLIPDASVDRLVAAMHERGGFVTLREVTDPETGVHSQQPYEINISLFSAFGGTTADLPAYLGAHTLLLSFQGIPALYVHSVLATTNNLELVEQTGRTRSINRGQWPLRELERLLEDPDSAQARTLAHLRHIIHCRERQPALSRDAAQHVLPAPPGVFLMCRAHPTQTLTVAASVTAETQQVPVSGIDLAPGLYCDRLTGRHITVKSHLELAPYEVLWLDAE